MKCSRFVTITLLAALTLGSIAATVQAAEKPKSVAAPSSRSPQDIAKEALARWKTTLNITAAQTSRFESIMIDSYRRMAQAKSSAAGDKAKQNELVLAVFKDREASLASVLTSEQMLLYRQHVHHATQYATR